MGTHHTARRTDAGQHQGQTHRIDELTMKQNNETITNESTGKLSMNMDHNTPECATFAFQHEDHTIGNSLRYMIMKNPDISFCGYSIPHPAEPVMNLRIQTNGKETAAQAFEHGLHDLLAVCDHVKATFQDAVKDFEKGPKTAIAMDVDE